MALFDKIRIEDDAVRDWFRAVLKSKTHDSQADSQVEALDRSPDESAELALRVFELSQVLRQKWLTADYAEKRKILEIFLLNCRLDGATLVPTIRKPFDVPAEGLVFPQSAGGRTPIELFLTGVSGWDGSVAQVAFFSLVTTGVANNPIQACLQCFPGFAPRGTGGAG